ncbi:unnamed protein product, partial [Meganyctiphanes norvegica]
METSNNNTEGDFFTCLLDSGNIPEIIETSNNSTDGYFVNSLSAFRKYPEIMETSNNNTDGKLVTSLHDSGNNLEIKETSNNNTDGNIASIDRIDANFVTKQRKEVSATHETSGLEHNDQDLSATKNIFGSNMTPEDTITSIKEVSEHTAQDISETKTTIGPTSTPKESIISIKEDECIFCLESTNLIHFCECTVMVHKKCAVRYITYPANVSGRCPMCRRKLHFDIVYSEKTMKTKFMIYAFLIILANLAVVALSMYFTTMLIPQNEMSNTIYVLVICNVGIIIPVTLVFIISMIVGYCGPKTISSSHDHGWSSVCWGGCPDCSWYMSGGCDGCGDGGEIVMLVVCLITVLSFWISAIVYMIYNVWRYLKSFIMKSAIDIRFQKERKYNDDKAKNTNITEHNAYDEK